MPDDAAPTTVPVTGGVVALEDTGPRDARPVVLLHGWPEDRTAWRGVVEAAGPDVRCIAVDLPGIGGSRLDEQDGSKARLAELVHEALAALDVRRAVLVGHDAGGMVVLPYLRRFGAEVDRAVIMDTVVPGIEPWSAVLANPYVWHFAFHSIPGLPERLVQHEVRAYFDFFWSAITAHPEAIDEAARERYVLAYSRPEALRQGFELYRAFRADAAENAREHPPVDVPLLYLRGSAEGGDVREYAEGFRAAGLTDVRSGAVQDAGHFAPEEAPAAVWAAIRAFIG